MIKDYFKPLTLQIDSGLGATADSFYYSAKALDENQESKYGFGLGGGKLPNLYLYRHCIELYLKSVITLIYRLCPLQGTSSKTEDNFPLLRESQKEKKIFNVHSIGTLFENFLRLLEENRVYISEKCESNWFDFSEEIPLFIKKIEEYDKNSTMFRYPITMNSDLDYKKSTFKKFELSEMTNESIVQSASSKIFFLVEGENDEIVESYVSDDSVLNDIHEILKELATQLMGLHFGLKYELTK